MQKIVLDAGHGGRLPGCVYGGYQEKEIVLAIALRVGQLIDENLPDVEVIHTRKSDVNVDLEQRARIANQAKADLFVSIHVNAAPKGATAPNGSSTWVMGLSKEEANLELAMRENSVITYEENYQTKYEGFDPNDPVSYIMFSLMQSAHFDQSVKLARLFQEHYKQNTAIGDRGLDQNAFLVLHRTTMPSVLTEIGFLSNEKDRKYIVSKTGQERIARSIFEAIREYKSMVEGNARIAGPATSGRGTTVSDARSSASQPQTSVAADPGVVFRIQVSALPSRAVRSRFGPYADRVEERKIGNLYKYFVGETDSYAEALSLQQQIQRRFRDAFIVVFENDRPVALTEEMKRN
jgi:N-acetylmuramoyl-L-alanine amidase